MKYEYVEYAVVGRRGRRIGFVEVREDADPMQAARDFYGKRAASVERLAA